MSSGWDDVREPARALYDTQCRVGAGLQDTPVPEGEPLVPPPARRRRRSCARFVEPVFTREITVPTALEYSASTATSLLAAIVGATAP